MTALLIAGVAVYVLVGLLVLGWYLRRVVAEARPAHTCSRWCGCRGVSDAPRLRG